MSNWQGESHVKFNINYWRKIAGNGDIQVVSFGLLTFLGLFPGVGGHGLQLVLVGLLGQHILGLRIRFVAVFRVGKVVQILISFAVDAHPVDILLLADCGIRGSSPVGIVFRRLEEFTNVDMGSWYGGKGIQSDGCYRIVLQIQHL